MTTKSGFDYPTFDEELVNRRAVYQGQFGDYSDDSVQARLAEIDAEMMGALHQHFENTLQQMFPLYAVGDWLSDWGTALVGPQKEASAASGQAQFTAAANADVIAAGSQLQIGSVLYQTTADASVSNDVVTVSLIAQATGTSGNAAGGTSISLISPVNGVQSTGAVVDPGLTGGNAAETPEEYRARYLVRLQSPPAGGSDTDYISWALAVAGVTRAWVQRGAAGSGQVLVLFMMDDTYSPGIPVGSGAPGYSGDLLTVYTAIAAQAPNPAVLTVAAPTPKPINVVIDGLDPSLIPAVKNELQDVFRRRCKPGLSVRKSWITEAVALVAGEDGYDDISQPSLSVVCAATEIGVPGTVNNV